MRPRVMKLILAVAVVLTFSVASVAMRAQTQTAKTPPTAPAPAAKAGIPKLSGVWVSTRADGGGLARFFNIKSWPTQPWAEQEAIYNRGHEELDPSGGMGIGVYSAADALGWQHCAPIGPSASWQHAVSPFEIIQTPEEVIIIYEWDHGLRQIWLDGRPHPKDLKPTWMGHSVGHYENGDTLVIDTVGVNPITRLDRVHPHTDALHLVEKLTRKGDIFTLEITFDDPRALTKPVTGVETFHITNFELDQYILCEDWLAGRTTP